jgi:hypothetical protein
MLLIGTTGVGEDREQSMTVHRGTRPSPVDGS